MSELPANSKEENSPQDQQQRSNSNHTPRPKLNVLLPQPRFPVNSNDDSDGEYETDEYFGGEDFEDKKQEELKIMQLEFWVSVFGGLDNMLT
ncbi:hypothetical protein Gohar_018666, partial [Gossypium harknessii]|nr:hypothetical protein [Gossypium harknessii]